MINFDYTRANDVGDAVRQIAADPAGHYSRPDVTRLLLNSSRANRVEHFTLPVDAEVMSEIRLQA